jgi:hypothetical protein
LCSAARKLIRRGKVVTPARCDVDINLGLIRETSLHHYRQILIALIAAVSFSGSLAQTEQVCDIVNGSVLIAQDDENTFLGKITNAFDSNSIFNEFSTYGNPFSSKSIWNEFSTFGNKFNSDSPFNAFSSSPPMIIKDKKVIGYLSANKSINASISPNLLKALCKEAL